MTNEELFILAKDGCKLSENTLYENTKRIIFRLANTTNKKTDYAFDIDDLVSLGNMAWANTYMSFNPDLNIKFITLLRRCVVNEIGNYIKSSNRLKRKVNRPMIYLDQSSDNREGEETLHSAVLMPNEYGDVNSRINKILSIDFVSREIENLISDGVLKRNQKDYFLIHVLTGKNANQIAIEYKKARQGVDKTLKKAIIKVSQYYNNPENLERIV